MKAIWRHLIVMIALSVAISVVFMMIAVDDLSAFPWRYIFWRLAIGSTFGMCIGAISWSVMSRFAHAIWQLHPLPRWATLLAIFCACGAAGSFLAVLIVGEGEVDATAFLRALVDAGYDGPLTIECEINAADRLANVKTAIAKLEELLA